MLGFARGLQAPGPSSLHPAIYLQPSATNSGMPAQSIGHRGHTGCRAGRVTAWANLLLDRQARLTPGAGSAFEVVELLLPKRGGKLRRDRAPRPDLADENQVVAFDVLLSILND